MSRIASAFARLRAREERALIPYLTAGDPSLEITRQLVVEAEARGADLIELGFPFSDPLDRKSTRLNSSHIQKSRMPSSA